MSRNISKAAIHLPTRYPITLPFSMMFTSTWCAQVKLRAEAPKAGVVVARTPEDKRTLAHVDVSDAAMLAYLTDGTREPVGTAGQVVALDDGYGWRA